MNNLPNRRLLLMSITLSLLVLGLLAACSSDQTPLAATPEAAPPTATPAPPTATPLPRGGNLTIRLASELATLRPWQPRSRGEEQVVSLLYNGLMRLDDQLRPLPDLASRWDASADGRLITFTLRPDVSWHDGRELTSADVAFTLGALREVSPTTALLADLGRIREIRTPTTTTLAISLTERYAPLFAALSVPILPRHLFEGKALADVNFWQTPVGTGPFKFAERSNNTITLAANPNFYRGPPLLDRVAFLSAPDPAVAAAALGDGRLLLAELPWANWRPLEGNLPGTQLGLYPENGYYFLAYNMRQGRPFADPRVRRALSSVIDLPTLVASATDSQGAPIANSAAPNSWADFVRPTTATVDLAQAGTLLDEAGWRAATPGAIRQREGVSLTAQLFVRSDDPRRIRAAELIAQAGDALGMEIVVQRADFATVIRSKYAPPYDFDLLLGSWSNGPGDPDFADYSYYDPSDFALFHSSQISQGANDQRTVLNLTGFRDTAYDNQATAARQLYDLAGRSQALRLAQQRIAELQPYLFLWADQIGVALSGQLTTLDGPVNLDTPMYLWNIERWYFRQ